MIVLYVLAKGLKIIPENLYVSPNNLDLLGTI